MHTRGTFATTTVDGHEGVLPAGYFEFDDQRVGFRHAAPAPGADTDSVRDALRRGASPFAGRALRGHAARRRRVGPLAGLRVLEFTQLMAGPETGKLLRDQGADVIRVESRAFPDQSRVFGGEANMSSQFVTINRNKRSLGIDLRSPEGRELILQLMAVQRRGDREPRARARSTTSGSTSKRCAPRNPRIVVVSSQLFGDRGPWGWWRGFGTHAAERRRADVALALSRHRSRLRREPDLLPRPVRGAARCARGRWRASATAAAATSASRRPTR